MSSYARITTTLVFHSGLNVELPPSWNQIFPDATQPQHDTCLPVIHRGVHPERRKQPQGRIAAIVAPTNSVV